MPEEEREHYPIAEFSEVSGSIIMDHLETMAATRSVKHHNDSIECEHRNQIINVKRHKNFAIQMQTNDPTSIFYHECSNKCIWTDFVPRTHNSGHEMVAKCVGCAWTSVNCQKQSH